jgi:hypothetical protein
MLEMVVDMAGKLLVPGAVAPLAVRLLVVAGRAAIQETAVMAVIVVAQLLVLAVAVVGVTHQAVVA